jgi:hypothetical protein
LRGETFISVPFFAREMVGHLLSESPPIKSYRRGGQRKDVNQMPKDKCLTLYQKSVIICSDTICFTCFTSDVSFIALTKRKS